MISGSIMALFISILGVYFYILNTDERKASTISFLPLPSLCVYMFSYALGAPIPWVMMAELSAPEVKGLASSISAASNWIMAFVITLIYPLLSEAVGNYTTFWLFGGFLVICLTVIVMFVPETKGRSLEEIQQFFRSGMDSDESSIIENEETIEEEDDK